MTATDRDWIIAELVAVAVVAWGWATDTRLILVAGTVLTVWVLVERIRNYRAGPPLRFRSKRRRRRR